MKRCPECGGMRIWCDGVRQTATGPVQRYLCRLCGFRFSESTAHSGIKGDILSQVFEQSNSRKDLLQSNIFQSDFSFKPAPENPSLKRGEHVASHVSSKQTITVKALNTFADYNRERLVCVSESEAKNLATVETPKEKAQRGATAQTQADAKGKIVEFAWWLKKEGYRESTIITWVYILKSLVKHGANLLDPESVKETIANLPCNENTKVNVVAAYTAFARMLGLTWKQPGYKMTAHLPFIPTETEIDQVIAATGRRTSTFLQLLKETGMRSGEAAKLKWTDVDFERNAVTVNSPEKNSNARIFKVSSKLMAMINALPRKSDRIFGPATVKTIRCNFRRQRPKIAKQLQNPRLNQIKFHTLRHWKATMEYHRTKDILHVMKLLGHKRIENTLIYTQLINFESDEYACRIARTEQEIHELIEAGFEYVTEYGDAKFFRKRK